MLWDGKCTYAGSQNCLRLVSHGLFFPGIQSPTNPQPQDVVTCLLTWQRSSVLQSANARVRLVAICAGQAKMHIDSHEPCSSTCCTSCCPSKL